MNGLVVVDASLACKWLVLEADSEAATALAERWVREGTRRIGPYLLPVEVANVLHQRVRRGELNRMEAHQLLEGLCAGVELVQRPELHTRALALAGELGQGSVYDSHYLALAELERCELWTADARFFHSAVPRSKSVHLLAGYR